jgi:lysozyme
MDKRILISLGIIAVAGGLAWWYFTRRDKKETMTDIKNVNDLPQSALDIIKSFEVGNTIPGKKADGLYYSYNDGAGIKTIGIGHLNTKDNLEGLTYEQVIELFRSDIKSAFVKTKAVIKPEVFKTLTGSQVGMLVSFMFNTGAAGSTLFKLVETRQWNALLRKPDGWWRTHYITANGKTLQGLINRRNKEADIFLNDVK